jgi:hypothetical protein
MRCRRGRSGGFSRWRWALQEDYGYFGFDHLPQTFLTLFAQIALDGGFHDVPHLIQKTDVGSTDPFVWGIFASVVVVVNLLVLNLFVAIVVSSFTSTHTARAHTVVEEQQRAAVMEESMSSPGLAAAKVNAKKLDAQLRLLNAGGS